MSTYCVQFIGAARDVLDTQYVTAGSERQAKEIALRKTKNRDWQDMEVSRL